MKHVKSRTKHLATFLFCLPLALLALHGGANMVQSHELEAQLADIRAKGEPLTLAESAPPLVPDAENAARVYQQALDLLAARKSGPEKTQDAEETQAVSDFVRSASKEPVPVPVGQIREILAERTPILALVRRAAAMPRCRFPINYEAGAGALFPHLGPIREIARLLAANARVAALDGHADAAVEEIEAMVSIARHIGLEPVMISQTVQYSVISLAATTLDRVLEVATPSPEAIEGLARQLAEQDLRSSYTTALLTERTFGIGFFDLVNRDPAQAAAILGAGEDAAGGPPGGIVSGLKLAAGPILKKDEAFYLQWMSRQIDRARNDPQGGSRTTSTGPAVSTLSVSDDTDIPRFALVTRAITPAFSLIEQKRDAAERKLRLARKALTRALQQPRTGSGATTLGDLRK